MTLWTSCLVCGFPLYSTDHDNGCPNADNILKDPPMNRDDDDSNDCYDDVYDDSPNYDDQDEKDTLAYKDEVSLRVVAVLEEYLSFATMKDLIKLLVNNEVIK